MFVDPDFIRRTWSEMVKVRVSSSARLAKPIPCATAGCSVVGLVFDALRLE